MKTYFIVYHFWHVDSRGWEREYYKAKTKAEAEMYAKSRVYDLSSTFRSGDYLVEELPCQTP